MTRNIDLDAPLEGLRYERREDGIAVITLDRPERGNSLAPGMQPVFRAIWLNRLPKSPIPQMGTTI